MIGAVAGGSVGDGGSGELAGVDVKVGKGITVGVAVGLAVEDGARQPVMSKLVSIP